MARRSRNTAQRMKILHYVQNTHSHPTAEEVYEYVKEDMPSISLATVYRNLNLLAEQGVVVKIREQRKWRFDGREGSHQHAIDMNTGSIIDVDQPELAEWVLKHVKIKKFVPQSVRMIFYGTKK
jgi:Fur family transcriptional regulator, peroxide stress response regulator